MSTPGPWSIKRGYEGWEVHAPDGLVSDGSRPEDARLIAAAPELLEALEHLRDALQLVSVRRSADSPVAKSLRVADAAIAKARGGA